VTQVADRHSASAAERDGAGRSVRRARLAESPAALLDKGLQGQLRAVLELVARRFPGVARLACRDEIVESMSTASGERHDVV
jgi:hypothetical protein